MSYFAIFITAFFASVHCAMMFSGFILAYSVKKTSDGQTHRQEGIWKKHLLFNGGRLVSFTIIGAILGAIGSFFTLSATFNAWITIAAAAIMVLYGLSMFGAVSLRKMNNFVPRWLYKLTKDQAGKDGESRFGKFQPAVLGVLTTLIPCGPIQALQILALGSGSILQGAVIMFITSIATAPLLMGLGGVVTKMAGALRQKMIRYAAIAILIFAVTTFDRGLALAGSSFSIVPDLDKVRDSLSAVYGANNSDSSEETAGALVRGGVQELKIVADGRTGYSPETVFAKKDIPVKLTVEYKGRGGCIKQFLIPTFGVNVTLPDNGLKLIEFTPNKTGSFTITCGMGMYRGTLVVEN